MPINSCDYSPDLTASPYQQLSPRQVDLLKTGALQVNPHISRLAKTIMGSAATKYDVELKGNEVKVTDNATHTQRTLRFDSAQHQWTLDDGSGAVTPLSADKQHAATKEITHALAKIAAAYGQSVPADGAPVGPGHVCHCHGAGALSPAPDFTALSNAISNLSGRLETNQTKTGNEIKDAFQALQKAHAETLQEVRQRSAGFEKTLQHQQKLLEDALARLAEAQKNSAKNTDNSDSVKRELDECQSALSALRAQLDAAGKSQEETAAKLNASTLANESLNGRVCQLETTLKSKEREAAQKAEQTEKDKLALQAQLLAAQKAAAQAHEVLQAERQLNLKSQAENTKQLQDAIEGIGSLTGKVGELQAGLKATQEAALKAQEQAEKEKQQLLIAAEKAAAQADRVLQAEREANLKSQEENARKLQDTTLKFKEETSLLNGRIAKLEADLTAQKEAEAAKKAELDDNKLFSEALELYEKADKEAAAESKRKFLEAAERATAQANAILKEAESVTKQLEANRKVFIPEKIHADDQQIMLANEGLKKTERLFEGALNTVTTLEERKQAYINFLCLSLFNDPNFKKFDASKLSADEFVALFSPSAPSAKKDAAGAANYQNAMTAETREKIQKFKEFLSMASTDQLVKLAFDIVQSNNVKQSKLTKETNTKKITPEAAELQANGLARAAIKDFERLIKEMGKIDIDNTSQKSKNAAAKALANGKFNALSAHLYALEQRLQKSIVIYQELGKLPKTGTPEEPKDESKDSKAKENRVPKTCEVVLETLKSIQNAQQSFKRYIEGTKTLLSEPN